MPGVRIDRFLASTAAALLIAGLAVPILERTTEPYLRALYNLDESALDAALAPRQAQFRLDLRSLLAIPSNYKVLFLQGGAIAENAVVPLNLLGERSIADYVNTGEWSKKSIKEAKKYCTVNVAASLVALPAAFVKGS